MSLTPSPTSRVGTLWDPCTHCSARSAHPTPPGQEIFGERLHAGHPTGLGARSHPRPWPLAQGRVGNHRFYFWFSPWEVLQEGGREHPDLVPEVLEVLSLE